MQHLLLAGKIRWLVLSAFVSGAQQTPQPDHSVSSSRPVVVVQLKAVILADCTLVPNCAGISDRKHAGSVSTVGDPSQSAQPGKANWRQARPPKKKPVSEVSNTSLEREAAMLAGMWTYGKVLH